MNIKYLPIIIISILITVSCEFNRSLEGESVNIRADEGRTSDYEEYGDFYLYSAYKDIPAIEDTTGSYIPPLALASNKVVLTNLDGKVMLLTGKVPEWIAQLDSNAVAMSAMCADADQNIYLAANNETVYSYSKTGEFRWKKHFPHPREKFVIMSDMLALKDGIAVASSKGMLAKISFKGNILWQKKFSLPVGRTFAADIEGNMAIPLTHKMYGYTDTLLFIDSEGKALWSFSKDQFSFMTYPVISDSRVYIAGVKGKADQKKNILIALDNENGKLLWESKINQTPRYISSDLENCVYVVSYDIGLGKPITTTNCISADGKLKWESHYNTTAYSPLLISEEYLAFSGRTSNTRGLYFMDRLGKYIKTVSLSNLPEIVMTPEVKPDGVTIFAGSKRLAIVRTDEIWINKIIPW